MASSTLTPSVASQRDIQLSGGRKFRYDGPALLVLVCAAILGLMVAYSRTADLQIGVAGRYNAPYLHNFHDPEILPGQEVPTYRWTAERSTIAAPGLGRGTWETQLTLSSPQPAGTPKRVTLDAGASQWPLQLTAEPRTFHLLTPSNGDLVVNIEATTARYGDDPRALGVVYFSGAFEPIINMVSPPLPLLFFSLMILALAFVTLRMIGLPTLPALLGPLGGLLLLAWSLAVNRGALGLLLGPRLLILAVVGLIMVWILQWAWNRLVALGRLQPEAWLLPALLTVFYVGFWIKSTGVLYPYSHVIDVPWHMQRTREILGGYFWDLYQPGAFDESVMPTREWGADRPVIPYSPFFHIFAALFAIFPWKLETSANVFAVLVDTSRALMVAALALKFGLRSRAAFLAALLLAITPFTYLLHSWGNTPTTFGLWWTLLATTVIMLAYDRLTQPRVFALLTAVLLATMLFYTVTAVFMGMFIVVLLLGLLIWGRGLPRRSAPALAGALGLAVLLSMVIYYGQYIGPITERTLPYINRTVVGGQQGEGQDVIEPFGKYVSNYVPHIGYVRNAEDTGVLRFIPLPLAPSMYVEGRTLWYGVALPLAIGLPGIWLLRRQRLALLILGSWLVVATFFFLAGTRVSMVDKHLFYIMPALIITTAGVLDWAWTRWRWLGFAIVLLYAGTFMSALQLWLLRLQRVS